MCISGKAIFQAVVDRTPNGLCTLAAMLHAREDDFDSTE
jgi:hypothetical protein